MRYFITIEFKCIFKNYDELKIKNKYNNVDFLEIDNANRTTVSTFRRIFAYNNFFVFFDKYLGYQTKTNIKTKPPEGIVTFI